MFNNPVVPPRSTSMKSSVAVPLRPLIPETSQYPHHLLKPNLQSTAMPLQPMDKPRRRRYPRKPSHKPDIHGVPDPYGGHSEYPLTGTEYQAWIRAYSGTNINLSEVEKPVIFTSRGFLAAPMAINENDRLDNVQHLFDVSNWSHGVWYSQALQHIMHKYHLDAGMVTAVERKVVRTHFNIGRYSPKPKIGRNISLDGHTILTKDQLVLKDTHTDWRTQFNPLVQSSPYISFYAGVPIFSKSNHRMGVLSFVGFWTRKSTPEGLIEDMKQLACEITAKVDNSHAPEPFLGSRFLQVLSPLPIWQQSTIQQYINVAHRRGQMWASSAQFLSNVLNIPAIAFYEIRLSFRKSCTSVIYPFKIGYTLKGYTSREASCSAKTYSIAAQSKAGICLQGFGVLIPFNSRYKHQAPEKNCNEDCQKLPFQESAANIKYRNPEYFKQTPDFTGNLHETCHLIVLKCDRAISMGDVSFTMRVIESLEKLL